MSTTTLTQRTSASYETPNKDMDNFRLENIRKKLKEVENEARKNKLEYHDCITSEKSLGYDTIQDAENNTKLNNAVQNSFNHSESSLDKKSSKSWTYSGRKHIPKPMWAMTEEEADLVEEDEANELLQFVESLDFEEFISDLKVREAIGMIKSRVKELETQEENVEEGEIDQNNQIYDESSNETSNSHPKDKSKPSLQKHEPKKQENNHDAGTKKLYNTDSKQNTSKEKEEWDNTTQISANSSRNKPELHEAQKILKQNDITRMKQVHSATSIASLLRNNGPAIFRHSRHKTGDNSNSDQKGEQRILLDLQRDPNRVQGLPYMYRCPAV